MKFDEDIQTPYYLIDESLLIKNLEKLAMVKHLTGCKILLAQKAFSCFYFYPLIKEYIDGTTASGLNEARLGKDEMGGENHIFSPAYKEEEFEEILDCCDHIVFNSINQLKKFKDISKKNKKNVGIRINPECSTQSKAIYDPCAPFSRMGIRGSDLSAEMLEDVDGFHFHTLCEQDSDALELTLMAVEKGFGKYFGSLKWINFGGGHHITKADYDIERLISLINKFKMKYGIQVYLEPGEAVVLNSGFLVATVLDIIENEIQIVILDASAACHMPDVLEMPYKPSVIGAKINGKYKYRLSCNTCLAGDIIGDYTFDKPLNAGDKVVFEDMALYTMVKNNTFNGINLPSIAVRKKNGELKLIKVFGYQDFKGRLS